MKKIGHAVIGAGFGDEGKGLMTDFLARKFTNQDGAPTNIRFNGGAQAGHTVVDGDKRHVFGHFGAATFANSATHLSSNFIINPYAYKREYAKLREYPCWLSVSAHPYCEVTTIFDMVLNGLNELSRGGNRHGSCGMGINETVTRKQAGHTLKLSDLRSRNLKQKLQDIYVKWWAPRLGQIDFKQRKMSDADTETMHDLLKIFYCDDEQVDNLSGYNMSIEQSIHPADTNVFIFEGAQGLQLDEFLGTFPHVTRSVTGLPAAIVAAHEVGVSEINPIYVTRAYKTRHGAGSLSHEGEEFSCNSINDATNTTGQWQGEFRTAPLDLAELKRFINADMERSKEISKILRVNVVRPRLAVTCLDQVDGANVTWYGVNGVKYNGRVDSLLSHLDNILPIDYISYGPSASDVTGYPE